MSALSAGVLARRCSNRATPAIRDLPHRACTMKTSLPHTLAALGACAALLAPLPALAAGPGVPGLDSLIDWRERNLRDDDPKPSDIQLINYFFVRATFTNQLADPSGLKGVSLGPFGLITGSSTRTGEGSRTFYVEQRWIPVIAYSPSFADGLATFRAQLEIDFTWGLAANQVQPNQGGGFNADQINVQTKNVNAAITPTRDPDQLDIILGTQSFYDSVYDPTTTSLFDIVRTGYKLTYLGTDATGVAAYSKFGGLSKLSFIPIGSAQPDKASKNDARFAYAYLFTADYAYKLWPGTYIGASYWHLKDDTKGAAYAYEGLVKSGPSSTGLGSFTGTARFNMDDPTGHVEYLGLNFHHNLSFATSNLSASGFFMYNFGKFKNNKEGSKLLPEVDISGYAANLELAYRWGRTNNDLLTLEGMYTSGDADPNDGKYKSAFTMNYYGLPGAVWFNHKTLLLYPFTSTVNNYTGAVTDISNQGYGVTSAILTAAGDIIPNKLNVKIGAATAQSSARPQPYAAGGPQRGRLIGVEGNIEVKYQLRYLMTVGLHAGYMKKGSFYEGNSQLTSDPWAAFTTFTWYAF
ncbi:Hypothetical protein A7982_00519 [Minicystis rosea]|nr:Hypothetical protein A7982_00519 [Minicystis rosea]